MQKLIADLEGMISKAKRLQLIVAGAESATGSASDANKSPPLPVALLHSFEDIVMAHVLMAKRLSLESGWMTGDSTTMERVPENLKPKVVEVFESASKCISDARDFLDQSYIDTMLLGTTSSKGAGISLESIGSGFLAAVIIGNLQKRGLDEEFRPSVLLELYQRYAAKLQYEARRKPKRRLFLDIQALQEELGAFQNVAESQQLAGRVFETQFPRPLSRWKCKKEAFVCYQEAIHREAAARTRYSRSKAQVSSGQTQDFERSGEAKH